MTSTHSDRELPPECWRAGDLEVNAGLYRASRAGQTVELPRLTFELLLALLRGAPNFVSNEELMQRVWKGLVVSPETVTQRVKLLRDALGDDPQQPRYIEGMRGRGYRLIPLVEAVSLAGTGTTAATAPASQRRRAWMLALVIVLVFLGVAAWWQHHAPDLVPATQLVTAEDRTAAILPFRVTGALSDGENLALGLADSVLSQLSGIGGLTIISRNSSFQLDAQKLGLPETGRLLGARYLVEGLIQQSKGKMRVTVSLHDSRNSAQLWTQQYERDAGDFFGMQDAVAAGVAHALESRIARLDPLIPASPRSENLEAFLAYLRGRSLLGRTTIVGSEAAAKEFQNAMELDPSFAPAIIGLYDARLQAANLRRTGMQQALAANAPLLAQAEKLQPNSGAALLARAMWSREPREVRAGYFERGLALDPANARAMTTYSELLDESGRREEGERWLARALRIDPLWPRARFRLAQRSFPSVGAAVEQQAIRTLELDPNYYPALQRQAKYRWLLHGDLSHAIAIIERAIASDPENPWGRHTAVAFYLDVNESQSAENVVRGNDVADKSTRTLRAQYRGDWRAAGEAALEDGSYVFGTAERWGVASALRDYALQGLQSDRIIQLLSQRYQLPLDRDWRLDAFNFREGLLLAHLLQAKGQREEATKRLDEVIAWIDANAFMGPVFNIRTRAQALALKGDGAAALAALAESFQQNDYTHWWYALQYDPVWNELRSDRRFVQIAAQVRAHIAEQSGELAQLRRDGEVPDRRLSASTPGDKAR